MRLGRARARVAGAVLLARIDACNPDPGAVGASQGVAVRDRGDSAGEGFTTASRHLSKYEVESRHSSKSQTDDEYRQKSNDEDRDNRSHQSGPNLTGAALNGLWKVIGAAPWFPQSR